MSRCFGGKGRGVRAFGAFYRSCVRCGRWLVGGCVNFWGRGCGFVRVRVRSEGFGSRVLDRGRSDYICLSTKEVRETDLDFDP